MLKYLGFLLLLIVLIYGGYYLVTYMQGAKVPASQEANP